MGRDVSSVQFEQMIRLVEVDGLEYLSNKPLTSSSMVVDVVTRESVREPVPFPSPMPHYYTFIGDRSANVPKPIFRHADVPLLSEATSTGGFMTRYPPFVALSSQSFGDTSIMQFQGGATVVTCVEPAFDANCFEKEEAEVELMSAFRNILAHAAEDSTATTLAIPALCLDTAGERLRHLVPKLNQTALIKGFHRLSVNMKQLLQSREGFTVELLVPRSHWKEFEGAFNEEPWQAPTDVFSIPKQSMYPQLPPPTTLLESEGWIGKRPELIEAVETNGRSLLEKPIYTLEGTLDKPESVLETLQLYGNTTSLATRLQNERKTAEIQFGKAKSQEYVPLSAGLQGVFFD